jgi:hypothetical protein
MDTKVQIKEYQAKKRKKIFGYHFDETIIKVDSAEFIWL